MGIISVDFDATGQQQIIYSDFVKYLTKYGNTMKQCLGYLWISRKPMCDSVWREVLYNILIEFGIPMTLVRLIKMCLNETYSRVRVGKYLFDMLPIKIWFETRCFIIIAL